MKQKILFIGDLNFYAKGFSRLNACLRLGYQVESFPHTPLGGHDVGFVSPSLVFRLAWKLKIQPDTEKINQKIISSTKKNKPDILWIEKGNMILPNTLEKVKEISPQTSIVSYSDDDMANPLNHTRSYKRSLQYYHTVFTTKSYNTGLDELPSLGAQNVIMVDKAYDLDQHFPIKISEMEQNRLGSEVSLIGTYSPEREELLKYLAYNKINTRVWGNGWKNCNLNFPNLRIERRPLVNQPKNLLYTKGIAATKINLGLLRKINRDLQTDRSIEIPACGGFLLAERSNEHERLFSDGKEAVFFNNKEDLLEKIKYFLAHNQERQRIAAAGQIKCKTKNYSHDGRMEFMLNHVLEKK